MSQRAACVLKTPCASMSHCGLSGGGSGNVVSAASMADMPQKPWSSLPREAVQLGGMKLLAGELAWKVRACSVLLLYVVSPV